MILITYNVRQTNSFDRLKPAYPAAATLSRFRRDVPLEIAANPGLKMAVYPKITIARSVGYRAQNNIADVRTVQERLNLLLDASRAPLVEDGYYGSLTKAMIGLFQSEVLGFVNPDQRVDPVGPTITAMNDPASKQKWQVKGRPPKPQPPKNDPVPIKPPDDPADMPKIAVLGPVDGTMGFDSFPPAKQVIGPAFIDSPPKRDGAWIMVPEKSTRSIRLGIDPEVPVQIWNKAIDEKGFVYEAFTGKPLLKASIDGTKLVIKGLQGVGRANCPLDIFQNGKHVRVYVSVKPRRVISVFAFHVQQGPLLKPRVSSGELKQAFEVANREIMIPQSNIELKLIGENTLSHKDIGHKLGRVVVDDNSNSKRDETKYLRPFMKQQVFPQPAGALPAKTVNMFIVRNIGTERGRRTKVLGNMEIETGMCMMDDRSFGSHTLTRGFGMALAHEVGHLLLGHMYSKHENTAHNPFPDALMYPALLGGTKLYRAEVEVMNPTSNFIPLFRRPS